MKRVMQLLSFAVVVVVFYSSALDASISPLRSPCYSDGHRWCPVGRFSDYELTPEIDLRCAAAVCDKSTLDRLCGTGGKLNPFIDRILLDFAVAKNADSIRLLLEYARYYRNELASALTTKWVIPSPNGRGELSLTVLEYALLFDLVEVFDCFACNAISRVLLDDVELVTFAIQVALEKERKCSTPPGFTIVEVANAIAVMVHHLVIKLKFDIRAINPDTFSDAFSHPMSNVERAIGEIMDMGQMAMYERQEEQLRRQQLSPVGQLFAAAKPWGPRHELSLLRPA